MSIEYEELDKFVKGLFHHNIMHTMRQMVDQHDKRDQYNVAIEELSELQKELTKNNRGSDNKHKIKNEITDVLIMIIQIIDYEDIELDDILAYMQLVEMKLQLYYIKDIDSEENEQ